MQYRSFQTAESKPERVINGPVLFLLLAVLAGLVFSVPARANIYNFVIPTTVIQTALDNAITAANQNTNSFGFYDFYLRPAVAAPADLIRSASTNVANYSATSQILTGATIVDFSSPIPTNANGDLMIALLYSGGGNIDAGRTSARYTYAPYDTREALITTNPSIAGKFYEPGLSAEYMPNSNFHITLDTPGVLTTAVRFEVSAYAYLFTDAGAESYSQKFDIVKGYFDDSSEVPEPAVVFTFGAGLSLIGIAGVLRRRAGK